MAKGIDMAEGLTRTVEVPGGTIFDKIYNQGRARIATIAIRSKALLTVEAESSTTVTENEAANGEGSYAGVDATVSRENQIASYGRASIGRTDAATIFRPVLADGLLIGVTSP